MMDCIIAVIDVDAFAVFAHPATTSLAGTGVINASRPTMQILARPLFLIMRMGPLPFSLFHFSPSLVHIDPSQLQQHGVAIPEVLGVPTTKADLHPAPNIWSLR